MKKIFYIALIVSLLLMSGCGSNSNHPQNSQKIYIVAYGGSDNTLAYRIGVDANINQSLFIYGYPQNIAGVRYFALEDENGNMVKDHNIQWSLSNQNLGNIIVPLGADEDLCYAKDIESRSVGTCKIIATYNGETAEADLVIYPYKTMAKNAGINLSTMSIVYNKADADIWENDDNSIECIYGYYNYNHKNDNYNTLYAATYQEIDSNNKILNGDIINYPMLYLVKDRNGSTYAVLMSRKDISWNNVPLTKPL